MRQHGNARLTPRGRRLLADRVDGHGWTVQAAATAAGVSRTTAHKWLRRARSGKETVLVDRPSAAKRVWNRTPVLWRSTIERLRRCLMGATAIAQRLKLALSTVSGVLRDLGLSSWRSVAPAEPENRYEREEPGDLVHMDVKRAGRFHEPGRRVPQGGRSRGAGYECVHVCVDDHSRLAYAEVLPNEQGATASGFFSRALQWYADHGVGVREVMTDNAQTYNSVVFQELLRARGVRHIRTRPYRPQTNGKVERLIRTLKEEWMYVRIYENDRARARALGPWLEQYNLRRPHRSLGGKPPITRLGPRV
ncbi:MAG: IS481 family transposase [Proteobacteria bacterium]|nr:IS481 family transposase [Pseudomonadota bacterium]